MRGTIADVFTTEATTVSENKETKQYPSVDVILRDWLTVQQAVEVISHNSGEPISEQAVRGLCTRGTLFAINLGTQWRIEPNSVENYRKQK